MDRISRVSFLATLGASLVLAGLLGSRQREVFAGTGAEGAELRIGGAVSTPLVLTARICRKCRERSLRF